MTTKVKPLRVLAAAAILSVGVAILAFMTRSNIAKTDYITYWAAGQQLVHRENPYSGPAILRVEKEAGYTGTQPFFMRNPPWGLFIALPLGFIGASLGSFAWSVATLGALMGSIHLLRRKFAPTVSDLHLIGYGFPPVMFCLMEGQIGMFLLFGFVLFLYFQDSKPYLAGVSLIFLALKPHLFLPFGAVLVVWIFTRRAYPILLGAAAAITASIAVASVLDHSVWSHYMQMIHVSRIQDDFIPTLSQLFRIKLSPSNVWLQTVPATVGCFWALWFFWTRRHQWDWSEQGVILLLVSVMLAPYAWFADQAVILAAILIGLYRAPNPRGPLLFFGCMAVVCIAEMLAGIAPRSWFYIWTTPAWLLWYVSLRRTNSVGILVATNVVAPKELM
jgi:Glycosyltransferase family 87